MAQNCRRNQLKLRACKLVAQDHGLFLFASFTNAQRRDIWPERIAMQAQKRLLRSSAAAAKTMPQREGGKARASEHNSFHVLKFHCSRGGEGRAENSLPPSLSLHLQILHIARAIQATVTCVLTVLSSECTVCNAE